MNKTPKEIAKELELIKQAHQKRVDPKKLSNDVRALKFEAGSQYDTSLDYFKQFSPMNLPTEDHLNDFFTMLGTTRLKRTAMMLALEYSHKQISEKLGLTMQQIIKIKRSKPVRVFLALYECVHLETEDEQIAFIKAMDGNTFDSAKLGEAKTVAKMVRNPSKQLRDIAKKFKGSGDEKRKILRDIVAFGMQTRIVEQAEVDMVTREVINDAVIGLCDGKLALQAMQELNRMDHEYHEDDTATSSIESQEERIARLKEEAKGFREEQRKVLTASKEQQAKMEKTQMKLVRK